MDSQRKTADFPVVAKPHSKMGMISCGLALMSWLLFFAPFIIGMAVGTCLVLNHSDVGAEERFLAWVDAHPVLIATSDAIDKIVIYGGSVLGIALVLPDLRSGQVKCLFPVIGILLNAFSLLVFGAIALANMLS